MLAREYGAHHNWYMLWLECDSCTVVHTFNKLSTIPLRVYNRWHNCMQLGLMVICSHIYTEGNCCADTMAALWQDVTAITLFHTMPISLSVDFGRDKHGPPNFRYL